MADIPDPAYASLVNSVDVKWIEALITVLEPAVLCVEKVNMTLSREAIIRIIVEHSAAYGRRVEN